MSDDLSIKSLKDLYETSMSSYELQQILEMLIIEVEEKITKSIEEGKKIVIIDINRNHYPSVSCGLEDPAKILTYNLAKILSKENYKFTIKKIENIYYFTINLQCLEIGQQLSDYINNFI